MELRVIENEDDELSIEIGGEDHTFMNVLKGALLQTEGVEAATYDMNPEQSGGQTDPILTIRTDEDTAPLDALEAAADSVQDDVSAFTEAFEAAA
jgi:DNA-directed RNA polymerase subunit L